MPASTSTPNPTAQFREIHKNTWLKRLSAEGRKITIGPKKSERSWVVFCVHDDTEAMLEGYAEPRQAPCHNPEWIVPLQSTLHISHALIPNSHEFEFVVTLPHEVIRFHAMSWEIMQEWVETLRSKLREMKILSPRENLYTKLPEIRAPLLPTRDPTSPLPAPPPVPAALVPGVEVVPHANNTQDGSTSLGNSSTAESDSQNLVEMSNSNVTTTLLPTSLPSMPVPDQSLTITTSTTARPLLAAMSNTLTQNLLNMLSDPMSAYSEQLNDEIAASSITLNSTLEDENDDSKSDDSSKHLTTTALLHNESKHNALHINDESLINSVRVDFNSEITDKQQNLDNCEQGDQLVRAQTSRSHSVGAGDNLNQTSSNESSKNNITELEISAVSQMEAISNLTDVKTNVTIIQVSNNGNVNTLTTPEIPPKLPSKTITADVFKFPETNQGNRSIMLVKQNNVQIIPSTANSSTIQVLTNTSANAVASNQYSTPIKKSVKPTNSSDTTSINNTIINNECLKMTTTVHVPSCDSNTSLYGTCYGTEPITTTALSSNVIGVSTPKLPKKIILSANTSGVTNITVNNVVNSGDSSINLNANKSVMATHDNVCTSQSNENSISIHYEKIFLSSSVPVISTATNAGHSRTNISPPLSPILVVHNDSTRRQAGISSTTCLTTFASQSCNDTLSLPSSPATSTSTTAITAVDLKKTEQKSTVNIQSPHQHKRNISNPSPIASRRNLQSLSPAIARRCIGSSPMHMHITPHAESNSSVQSTRPVLTRGLTEAVITSRPSRRDFHFLNKSVKGKAIGSNSHNSRNASVTNNNDESASSSGQMSHIVLNRANSESMEQRRRSSSTSDAHVQRSTRPCNANNNEFPGGGRMSNSGLRIQHPPQPFRSVENGISNGGSSNMSSSATKTTSPAAKRITLREQQVLQLRREIMHPGGVRLQLRRKDCVGSIAVVDAFGAVWVAGWKQKEHPVLYNALHIGDQLLSIAGIAITSATEANKIIRNTNTLFIEVLVRRLPFGRGYAIRREREGQCLGLIRDGNSATIVDVVPNSLAARHGLPPKAQSCDGSTLTFWVLTEINGRPLNLFFKDNEIRDRLNSVGRDISILVQPSDLVAKLKKQLKSLRSYKDYLVQ